MKNKMFPDNYSNWRTPFDETVAEYNYVTTMNADQLPSQNNWLVYIGSMQSLNMEMDSLGRVGVN